MQEFALHLTIYVEGEADGRFIEHLFASARYFDLLDISVRAVGGKRAVAKRLRGLRNTPSEVYAALVDADQQSVADSRELARHQLGSPAIDVFCAVPTIEAWYFADPGFATASTRTSRAASIVARTPLPEDIPYPKQLARNVFGPSSTPNYDTSVDVTLAMARSPSLRAFVEGIGRLMGVTVAGDFPTSKASDTRDIVSTLLRELPSQQIVWRTLTGELYSAGNLADAVSEGEKIGDQYATELLRVARDLIARQAKK